jgi:glycosyltransferase involved in cell wall biosynthesis
MSTISAVINTYNEGENIRRCLESISGYVDEIVISDMHSTDATVSICQEFNATIVYQPRRPFGSIIRQHGVDHAKHDWIFIIDADETAPESLFLELRRICTEQTTEIVAIPRINKFFGIDYTGRGFPYERIDRFYRKGSVEFEDHPHRWGKLHGRKLELPCESQFSIVHYGVHSVGEWIRKANDYTDFEARSLLNAGCKAGLRTNILRPLKIFWTHMVTYGGWRSGMAGLVFSLLWVSYWIIAAAKLWQISTAATHTMTSPSDASLKR